ncbi:hypothetical protein Tco_0247997 [Tanacetum coccineum]
MGRQTRLRNYQYLGSPQKGLYPKGPIHGMTPAQALTAIQTMADHSQKWHDGTTSRNIGAQLDAKFAKDLTSTRIVPSTRKLNKLKRSDMENLDEQHLLTGTMEENFV